MRIAVIVFELLLLAGVMGTVSATGFVASDHQDAFDFSGWKSYHHYIEVSLDPSVIEAYGGSVRIENIKVEYGYWSGDRREIYKTGYISDVVLTTNSNTFLVPVPNKIISYHNNGYDVVIDLFSNNQYFADP